MSDRRAHAHFTGTSNRSNISIRQSHENSYATRIYVNNSSPKPPPAYRQPTSYPPNRTPRPYDPPEGHSLIQNPFIYVLSYVMFSVTHFELHYWEKQTPEESQWDPKRSRLVFWFPLTLRVIWELIIVALLLYWGIPPLPSQILQPSAYISFFVSVLFTFVLQFPVGYCTLHLYTVQFPLGLVLYGNGRLWHAFHAGKRSFDLSHGYQYQTIHGFYRGKHHSRVFAVYACFSITCAVYAYWVSFRYLLPVLASVHL